MDDMDEEMLVDGNLGPADVDGAYDVWWDVGPFESSSPLLLLLLLFMSEVEIEKGPMGNSTSSTRTVPEALWRGDCNWRGEGLSSGSTSILGAALYTGDRLQQNQL